MTTNKERLTSGILVGREPHEPTFTRNGKEIWVTVRGEDRIAIVDVALASRESAGERAGAQRGSFKTINGPAQVWFSKDGKLAFVASQKVSSLDVIATNFDGQGRSRPRRLVTLDIKAQDPRGFTPFLKTSPDGREVWLSHKLADAVSAWSVSAAPRMLDTVALGENARPNHVEFVENAKGKAVYVSFARVDDGGPAGAASSRIAIIDRAAAAGSRKVVGQFFSQGREAHGLWTNPEGTRLYIAHEQDELPNTSECRSDSVYCFRCVRSIQAAIHHPDTAGRACVALGEAAQQKEHQSRLCSSRQPGAGRVRPMQQRSALIAVAVIALVGGHLAWTLLQTGTADAQHAAHQHDQGRSERTLPELSCYGHGQDAPRDDGARSNGKCRC